MKNKALEFALKTFIFILSIGLIVGGYLDFTRFYDNKILPGINISGVNIGDKTTSEAEPLIFKQIEKLNDQGFELIFKNNKFNPKLQDLGIKIETEDTIKYAYSYARQGSIITRIKENFNLVTCGYNSPLIISINQGKTNEFIDSIAPKIEIDVIDQKILKETNEVLDKGQDGLSIDKNQLITEINNKITAGQIADTITIPTITIPRGQQTINNIFAPGDYYGKYIDVNLTKQKMILFDNNKVVNEYPVSTGKWSMPTPVGTRYIQNKNARAWSPKYGLYMPYWNSLGDGYGIHELPEWPNGYKEGEAHLGTPVSHGCIRLGVGPAETVFNWAPVGTPVYIHK